MNTFFWPPLYIFNIVNKVSKKEMQQSAYFHCDKVLRPDGWFRGSAALGRGWTGCLWSRDKQETRIGVGTSSIIAKT